MAINHRWTDGTPIKSPEIIKLYLAGQIVGRRQRSAGSWHWLARCSVQGCGGTYNPTMAKSPRCSRHSKKFTVGGRNTNADIPARWRDQVVWRVRDRANGKKDVKPFAPCEGKSCSALVDISKDRQRRWLYCPACSSKSQRLRPYEAIYRTLVSIVPRRNKTRGDKPLRLALTYVQFAAICERDKTCAYCEAPIERPPHAVKVARKAYRRGMVGLDRKDPTKGYTLSNVVSCCGVCNRTKNNYISQEEMMILGALRSGRIDKAIGLAQRHADLSTASTSNDCGWLRARIFKRLDESLGRHPALEFCHFGAE